jgi:diphosphomevalonate decarboxylase
MHTATARVGSNIAFIKYWGVSNADLNLPLNNSISMTLADAFTTTTVAWNHSGTQRQDAITLDGRRVEGKAADRLVRHLDILRGLAGVDWRATVESANNFPMAAGIASSASGFAALTVAGSAALGLDLSPTRLSAVARMGSGSASRSLFGGFVEWQQGHDDATSIAYQLFPEAHWALRDIVAVVSKAEKRVSSAGGHQLALTSPLNAGRVAGLPQALADVRAAIATRDLARLGPVIEQDALAMHGVMMTSTPSLMYWEPGSLDIMHAARRWREEDGLPVYFTIDAGPNIHLICEERDAAAVVERLNALGCVEEIIVSRPGPGPEVTAGA